MKTIYTQALAYATVIQNGSTYRTVVFLTGVTQPVTIYSGPTKNDCERALRAFNDQLHRPFINIDGAFKAKVELV